MASLYTFSLLMNFKVDHSFHNTRALFVCVRECVLMGTHVGMCVPQQCVGQRQGARQDIKTVTGRSHLVFNFTWVSARLWGFISPGPARQIMLVVPYWLLFITPGLLKAQSKAYRTLIQIIQSNVNVIWHDTSLYSKYNTVKYCNTVRAISSVWSNHILLIASILLKAALINIFIVTTTKPLWNGLQIVENTTARITTRHCSSPVLWSTVLVFWFSYAFIELISRSSRRQFSVKRL